jgi:lactate 2-monooxygenase
MVKDGEGYDPTRQAPESLVGRLPMGAWPVSPDDWREAARARLEPGPWGYLEGGAGGEETLRANRAAFGRWALRPRILRDVAERDLSVEVLGRRLPVPFLLAPVGIQSVMHPDADEASARAAAARRIPFVASTFASLPMERLAAAMGDAPRWFQLYAGRNREITASMVERAQAANFEALVVTVDTVLLGWRERDLGHSFVPFTGMRGMANHLSDPVFLALLARPAAEDPEAAMRTFDSLFANPSLSWPDIDAIRALWRGPLWLKGVTHPDDARMAADHGVDGVIVSTHGGRQVDGAIAALDALPAVVEAVGDRMAVLMDSGIRRGADVLKAMALGAQAVLIGRLYQYGLAAGGEAGVGRVLDNLAADLDVTLALCGRRDLVALDRSLLARISVGGG